MADNYILRTPLFWQGKEKEKEKEIKETRGRQKTDTERRKVQGKKERYTHTKYREEFLSIFV